MDDPHGAYPLLQASRDALRGLTTAERAAYEHALCGHLLTIIDADAPVSLQVQAADAIVTARRAALEQATSRDPPPYR